MKLIAVICMAALFGVCMAETETTNLRSPTDDLFLKYFVIPITMLLGLACCWNDCKAGHCEFLSGGRRQEQPIMYMMAEGQQMPQYAPVPQNDMKFMQPNMQIVYMQPPQHLLQQTQVNISELNSMCHKGRFSTLFQISLGGFCQA